MYSPLTAHRYIGKDILLVTVLAGLVIEVGAEKTDGIVIKYRIYTDNVHIFCIFVEMTGNHFVCQRSVLAGLALRAVGCSVGEFATPSAFICEITHRFVPGTLAVFAYPAFGIHVLPATEKAAEQREPLRNDDLPVQWQRFRTRLFGFWRQFRFRREH